MGESVPDGARLIAGRYRLGHLLGRGGMGAVWAAHDEVLDRDVAVKEVVPPDDLPPEQRELVKQRTRREARAAARIEHPAAVTVYDVVEQDGHPWIVMQLQRGRTLADVLAADGPLAPAEAAGIGLDVLDALSAAHRAGVLHRDVKPSNVMVTETGGGVLTDFGIATVEGDVTLTSTGMLIGSPGYMSPEQARGERPTAASDLWSLGATLYAAVEGASPFRREGQLPTLHAILTQPSPPAPHAGPLRPVLTRLLTKDPERRPDAPEVRALLLGVLSTLEREKPPATENTQNTQNTTQVAVDRTISDQPPPPSTPTPDLPAPKAPAPKAPTPQPAPAPPPPPSLPPAPAPASQPRPLAPAPARPGPRETHHARTTLLLALAVVLVAAGLVWVNLRDQDPSASAAPPPTTRTTTPATAPATTANPTTTAPTATTRPPPTSAPATTTGATARPGDDVPAGFRAYQDATGFSVTVPEAWVRSKRGSSVYFREPGGRAYLQIDQTTKPKADALKDWQKQAAGAKGRFKGYRLLRLERVDYGSWDAADWEFTWTPSSGELHVLNRNVRVSDRRAYALLWSVPAAQWSERRADLSVVTRTFRPAS